MEKGSGASADLYTRGPPRAEIPGAMTGKPGSQHASKPANHQPDMMARESNEAPDTAQPGTGPGGPTPGARHDDDPPPSARARGADHGSCRCRSIHGPSKPQ